MYNDYGIRESIPSATLWRTIKATGAIWRLNANQGGQNQGFIPCLHTTSLDPIKLSTQALRWLACGAMSEFVIYVQSGWNFINDMRLSPCRELAMQDIMLSKNNYRELETISTMCANNIFSGKFIDKASTHMRASHWHPTGEIRGAKRSNGRAKRKAMTGTGIRWAKRSNGRAKRNAMIKTRMRWAKRSKGRGKMNAMTITRTRWAKRSNGRAKRNAITRTRIRL